MTRLSKSSLLVAVGIAIFSSARLALFLLHRESFAELSGGQVVAAFGNGLRFDLSVLLTVLALPLVMMNLPLRACGKRWFDGWAWFGLAALLPVGIALAGDVAYYGYVERHLADELLVITNDLDFLVSQALGSYLPALLAVLLLAFALAWQWRRVLAARLVATRRPFPALLVIGVLLALGTRGTLDRKPLGLVDAYRSGSTAFGNLSLNGAFSALHAWQAQQSRTRHGFEFFEPRQAYAELGLEDAPYPLLRRSNGAKPIARNLVLVLLESWDPRYLDSYAGGGAGITPRFDQLASQSVRFDRCYSSSQRSVESIQALLTGVPPIAGEPSLGWGLRLARVSELGSIARSHGYQTLFVQSSKRRSYRLDSAARSLGFEHVYGQEDIPARLDYPGKPAPPKWGWDYETLMFALEQLDAFESPFLAVVFTGSTHLPYPDPGEHFHLRPHAASGEDAFVNLLHYSDWALGEFMDAARSRSWFDDTVFVVTADHNFRKAGPADLRANFWVPFLLHAPAALEPAVDSRVCSHLDGLPTFVDLLGFGDAYSSFGESLLHKQDGFALVKHGSVMGIISDAGSVSHSLEGRLEAIADREPADLEALERRLLSLVQVTHSLLRTNRWAPP